MGELTVIAAGISTVEKILPVVEAVGKEIGPLVEKELVDGKVVWADVQKAFADLRAAFDAVKMSLPAS